MPNTPLINIPELPKSIDNALDNVFNSPSKEADPGCGTYPRHISVIGAYSYEAVSLSFSILGSLGLINIPSIGYPVTESMYALINQSLLLKRLFSNRLRHHLPPYNCQPGSHNRCRGNTTLIAIQTLFAFLPHRSVPSPHPWRPEDSFPSIPFRLFPTS